jgi:hypothetical protein
VLSDVAAQQPGHSVPQAHVSHPGTYPMLHLSHRQHDGRVSSHVECDRDVELQRARHGFGEGDARRAVRAGCPVNQNITARHAHTHGASAHASVVARARVRKHAHARTCMHARRVRVGAVPCMLPLTWPLYTGSTPRIPARVLDQRTELKRKVRHAPIFLLHPCMVLYVPLFAECRMLYLTQRAHTQNTIHTTTQHSTAQHSTAQHSTAQHSTAQHSTAQHSTAQHSIMMGEAVGSGEGWSRCVRMACMRARTCACVLGRQRPRRPTPGDLA